jgi:hypothetical protein
MTVETTNYNHQTKKSEKNKIKKRKEKIPNMNENCKKIFQENEKRRVKKKTVL